MAAMARNIIYYVESEENLQKNLIGFKIELKINCMDYRRFSLEHATPFKRNEI